MASSATRWVRWRIKVKAHVLALICPFTACCGSLWVAVGALVASAPGVQAEEGQQRYTSRTTPHVTCEPNQAGLARAVSSIPTTPGRYHAAAHVRSTPQGNIELMPKKDVLHFKPVPRLEHVGDKCPKQMETREHRTG